MKHNVSEADSYESRQRKESRRGLTPGEGWSTAREIRRAHDCKMADYCNWPSTHLECSNKELSAATHYYCYFCIRHRMLERKGDGVVEMVVRAPQPSLHRRIIRQRSSSKH